MSKKSSSKKKNTQNGMEFQMTPMAVGSDIDTRKNIPLDQDEACKNLLELKDIIDASRPEYHSMYGIVRDEYLIANLAVQDAERKRKAHLRKAENAKHNENEHKRASNFMRDTAIISDEYQEDISRIIRLDQECLNVSGADTNIQDVMKRIENVLKNDLGLEILISLMTVSFFNLPTRGSAHVGHGFVIMTQNSKSQNNTIDLVKDECTLHFYEYDIMAGIVTNTTNIKTETKSYISGLYHNEEEEFVHSEEDDIHRLTSSMYGTLRTIDIIGIKKFKKSNTRIKSIVDTKGQDMKTDNYNICESILSLFTACWQCIQAITRWCRNLTNCCSISLCCGFTEHFERESSSIKTKMIMSLNDLILSTKQIKNLNHHSITRNPFINNINSNIPIHGTKFIETKNIIYTGLEIFYVDHITKTKEVGLIMFSNSENDLSILKLCGFIQQRIQNYGNYALIQYKDYTRQPIESLTLFGYNIIDPYKMAGLTPNDLSLLAGDNYIGDQLGLNDIFIDINVEISIPYKLLVIYANIIFAFASMICAALVTSENILNVLLVIYDIIHLFLRIVNTQLERNDNQTFRRDVLLFIVGMILANSINGDSDGRRLSESFEEGAPAPQPTSQPPGFPNNGTSSTDDNFSISIDNGAASYTSFILTSIQACLSILGAIIAYIDNKNINDLPK